MSRIHEALKKAEQDRAVALGLQIEPVHKSESLAMPTTGVLESAPPLTLHSVPSFSPQFTLEMLYARCLPGNWSPDKETMLFYDSDQAPGTEEFRTLRSRLYQLREKHPLKKVLVTSSLPKEGKSFVAANLAQAMVRQQGRRALLIDGDLRAARLHEALGTAATPGLSDYLLGEADEFCIMQRGTMENLFFVPAGRSTPNPAELVASGRLQLFLSRIEPLFDWIIIDTPPVIPVSDAGIMANHCDGVLMVVRSNVTPSDVARKARSEFDDKLMLGVVLNGHKHGRASYGDYYGTYGKSDEKRENRR